MCKQITILSESAGWFYTSQVTMAKIAIAPERCCSMYTVIPPSTALKNANPMAIHPDMDGRDFRL